MNVRRVTAALALGLAFAAPVASAQAHPLAGRWTVEYQRGMRNENGEMTPIMGTATLTLEQRGDSLVGTLVPTAGDRGSAQPAQQFAAKAGTEGATFVVTSQAQINMNGEISTRNMTLTWELSASGDALTGTMKRVVEDTDVPSDPAPVKGTRLKT
ncbi:MAG: hypothetical protein ACYC3L_15585 [Gemmatimonadaceae bacterium]